MASATEYLRVGSDQTTPSDWVPTWSHAPLLSFCQDLNGTIDDTRYASFSCAPAEEGSFITWKPHPVMKGGIQYLTSVQIKVRYQFQNWTDDNISVVVTLKDAVGSQVGNTLTINAAGNTAGTATSTATTWTSEDAVSPDETRAWYLEFLLDTATAVSTADNATFRIIGWEVIVGYEYDNTQRYIELAYVSPVFQEDTGYTGYTGTLTFTLPSGKNRKILGFWQYEEDPVSLTTGGFWRYNTNSATYDGDYWALVTASQQTDPLGIEIDYYDIPDGDSGSKTIYIAAPIAQVPVRFFFIVLVNAETGAPTINTFGRDGIGVFGGAFSTSNSRVISSSSDSLSFDDANVKPLHKLVLWVGFSQGGVGQNGIWEPDGTSTVPGRMFIQPSLDTSLGQFSPDYADFAFGTNGDGVFIALTGSENQNDESLDASRGTITTDSPLMGTWFRTQVPAASIDAVDSDGNITSNQGSATITGNLDGLTAVIMEGSNQPQVITAQTPTSVTFTYTQGDQKFGTNDVSVLLSPRTKR